MNQKISFSKVTIRDGFWKNKQTLNEDVTSYAVYDRFSETHRFDALKCRPCFEHPDWKPHIFWDSDVAKWLEGVSYILTKHDDPKLRKLSEDAISDMIKSQLPDGYYNCYYEVTEQDQRFRIRGNHELYCAGHLMEAAVAHFEETGERYFLDMMCRYADYIYEVFVKEDSAAFVTCGHPEVELALVRLYQATGVEKYLELARFFLNQRGNNEKDPPSYEIFYNTYDQSSMPLRKLEKAEGHAVRALYLYCAMADLAKIDGDQELFAACRRVFDNMVEQRMYITGGLGSTHHGEAFTIDYDLPNRTAYAETCASIAMIFFGLRMSELEADGKYADVIEREMYNGALSGLSLDGKKFFYENPLEIDPYLANVNTSTKDHDRLPIMQRVEVFDCSCCPPNLVRFLSSIGNLIYAEGEDTLFVHQYIPSETGHVTMDTHYPSDGEIRIHISGGYKHAALRIPGWGRDFSGNYPYTQKNGYIYIELCGEDEILLNLSMKPCIYAAKPEVHQDAGKVAVQYGPIVYCAEAVDNGANLKSIFLPIEAEFTLVPDEKTGLPALETTAYRQKEQDQLYAPVEKTEEPIKLRLIPYHAFANRGISEMLVWLKRK